LVFSDDATGRRRILPVGEHGHGLGRRHHEILAFKGLHRALHSDVDGSAHLEVIVVERNAVENVEGDECAIFACLGVGATESVVLHLVDAHIFAQAVLVLPENVLALVDLKGDSAIFAQVAVGELLGKAEPLVHCRGIIVILEAGAHPDDHAGVP